MGRVPALASLLLLIASGSAAAQVRPGAGGEPLTVVVEGESSCMSSDDFFRRIEARAPGIRRAKDGERVRTFVARLSPVEGQGALGQLRTREVDGRESVRELTGSSCADVADALTLVAAVTVLGDDIEQRPSSAPRQEPERPSVLAASAQPAEESGRPVLKLSCGGMGTLRTSVVPGPLFGVAVGCEASRDAAGWRPSVGLAAERTLTASTRTDLPDTSMTANLTLAQLFVSPALLRSGPLELRPVATFEVGRVAATGQGTGLSKSREDGGLWVAAGALARGTLRFGGIWSVSLGLGAEAPLTRYTFEFSPGVQAYRMAAVGFFGAVSLSIGLQ